MDIRLPEPVKIALAGLAARGYEAAVVGGCVRDSLMGVAPKDWDIATAALPEEAVAALNEYRIIETGLRHGTVTALIDGMPIEITTYRTDGAYTDHRHPDDVTFTRSLREDLLRRDFTVNALAYSPETGVTDYFGGREDLAAGILRCVGEPDRRFGEDALRIMRALRFSSTLEFGIEAATADSLRRNRQLLRNIADERLRTELMGLLCGRQVLRVLMDYPDVLGVFIPEILPMVGFAQRNPYHLYDVWEHTARAVAAAPPEPTLRLTLLLHDIGKPDCFTLGEDGVGHFYGHQAKSEHLARKILARLRFDNATLRDVCVLIAHHDEPIAITERQIRRWLQKMPPTLFRQLLWVKAADTRAHSALAAGRLKALVQLESMLDNVLEQRQCFSLRQLAVDGDDLIRIGVPKGKQLGALLQALLDAVIEERCPNDQSTLLDYAQSIWREIKTK